MDDALVPTHPRSVTMHARCYWTYVLGLLVVAQYRVNVEKAKRKEKTTGRLPTICFLTI